MAVGEFGIDAAGKVGPRHQLAQPIGRGLAARPDLIERIAAGLLALESVDAGEPQMLRRTAELQHREDANLRIKRKVSPSITV